MLELATEQAEYSPVPISAAARGLARDIRRRIATEDLRFDLAAKQLIEPVRARLRRFPARPPRPEMLAAVVNGWHGIPAIDWRLSCTAELEKARCSVVERRIAAGKLQREDWAEDEPDIGVVEITLQVDRNRLRLRTKCLCTLSMHAISRRLQRGPGVSDEAVLADINLAATAACGALALGAGYKIATDPRTGSGWRGRALSQRQPNGEAYPVLAIRTWL